MSRRLPPAPAASSTAVQHVMETMPRHDTGPELALRRELHRRGLRYRLHVRPLETLRCRADIVFSSVRLACFVDSCWWHACPEHLRLPKANRSWWEAKLAWTAERDERNNRALRDAGWTVIRVWEHEDPAAAADRVERLVRSAEWDADSIPTTRGRTGERADPPRPAPTDAVGRR